MKIEEENFTGANFNPWAVMEEMPSFDERKPDRGAIEQLNPDFDVAEFLSDKSEQNLEFLNEVAPELAPVYSKIIEENPELKIVKIRQTGEKDGEPESALYTKNDSKGWEYPVSAIAIDFEHLDKYYTQRFFTKDDAMVAKGVLAKFAFEIGANPDEVMRNRKLGTNFVLLHELGHAKDFIDNYLLTHHNKGEKMTGDDLSQVFEEYDADLIAERPIMPLLTEQFNEKKRKSPISQGEMIKTLARRLENAGVNPKDTEMVQKHVGKQYREKPSESQADTFATDFIRNHFNDYFAKPNEKSLREKRVRLPAGERTIKTGEYAEMLGLDQGLRVRIGQGEKAIEGFLEQNLWKQPNGELVILRNSDPLAEERRTRFGEVKEIELKFTEGADGKAKREILVGVSNWTDRDALDYYTVEVLPGEPKEIPATAEELARATQLTTGAPMVLIKQDGIRDMELRVGEALGGRLHSNVRVGETIDLENTNLPNFLKQPEFRTGETFKVEEIYRKWKTYHIRTKYSDFEVVPLQITK